MKIDNDNIDIETKFDANEFTINVTQETDFSYDGGYSFETLTNSGTIDIKEASVLISELQEFASQDPYIVDSSHTDPAEIETAAVLKWKKRAGVAEEALKKSNRQVSQAVMLLELLKQELGTFNKYGLDGVKLDTDDTFAGKSIDEFLDKVTGAIK